MPTLKVTDIPSIMDANRWPVAAKLLRRWLALPANSIPAKGLASLEVVTMEWVLKFERAKLAYQDIFRLGLWKSAAARLEIGKVLRKKKLINSQSSTAYARTAFALPLDHKDHIQYVSVGGSSLDMATSSIDHLTAALARFNFHVVVHGLISGPEKAGGLAQFQVSEVGVYVRDSYDFNDAPGEDQDLGNWDLDDNSVGRTWMNGGTSVRNSDFRAWRSANKKGGDYLIYSDIVYTKLAKVEVLSV